MEKSGLEPSGSRGAKPRCLQTCTHMLSKVWPEETTTGSNIKEPEMGQTYSVGGSLCLDLDLDLEDDGDGDGDLYIEIFHL